MGLADLFYSSGKATDKYQLRVGSDDKKLIQGVFPETGIMTSLSVYMFSQLADVLREQGITSYSEREKAKFTIEDLKRMCTLVCQKKQITTKKSTKK